MSCLSWPPGEMRDVLLTRIEGDAHVIWHLVLNPVLHKVDKGRFPLESCVQGVVALAAGDVVV
jgi:hypothetical protein